MAKRRDNTFLVVAAALAAAAWWLFKPTRNAGPATNQNGQVGGGVTGSPNQVTGGKVVGIDKPLIDLSALLK